MPVFDEREKQSVLEQQATKKIQSVFQNYARLGLDKPTEAELNKIFADASAAFKSGTSLNNLTSPV